MSNVFITMEQDPHPMTFDVRGLHDNGRCREESTKTLRSCFVYLFLPSFNVTFSPNTDTRYLQESPQSTCSFRSFPLNAAKQLTLNRTGNCTHHTNCDADIKV